MVCSGRSSGKAGASFSKRSSENAGIIERYRPFMSRTVAAP